MLEYNTVSHCGGHPPGASSLLYELPSALGGISKMLSAVLLVSDLHVRGGFLSLIQKQLTDSF